MQALEVRHVGDYDTQQVVELSGHKVTLHYFGNITNRFFERRQFALLLPVQADMHEHIARQAGLATG